MSRPEFLHVFARSRIPCLGRLAEGMHSPCLVIRNGGLAAVFQDSQIEIATFNLMQKGMQNAALWPVNMTVPAVA